MARRGTNFLQLRNGWYHFRRGVPADARKVFGTSEFVRALGTKDIAEARHLASGPLKEYESMLSQARSTVAPIDKIVGKVSVSNMRDIEPTVRVWLQVMQDQFDKLSLEGADPDGRSNLKSIEGIRAGLEATAKGNAEPTGAKWIADHLVDQNGWNIAEGSPLYRSLQKMIVRGQIENNERHRQELAGEPIRTLDKRFSDLSYLSDKDQKAQVVGPPLRSLIEGFLKERKPAPATYKAYRLHFEQFCDFLGHDDALKVKPEDIVRWKDALQLRVTAKGTTLAPQTINAKYLAVLKGVFSWAVENHQLEINPAARIRMRVGKQPKLRDRSLTDAEALTILRATVAPLSSRLSAPERRARRWIPWICAYTGARVNEITQLRGQDIYETEGIWVIRITPEAGSVKNNEARVVALHPHLLEQGFVTAMDGLQGPLFYEPSRHRGGSEGNPQYKKVGERLAKWVRKIGVDDPNVQPNHGWRHRFTTLARRHSIPEEQREQIVGRGPDSEGRKYGGLPVDVCAREIEKLPRYDI